MKCICGYEHQASLDSVGKFNLFLIGDEEFIKLDQRFDDFENTYSFRLYICPKCGTVRAEKYY